MTIERLNFGCWHTQLPTLILAALISSLAYAGQQSVAPGATAIDEEVAAAVREYAVELVVFEYTDSAPAGSETFLPDPIPDPMSNGGPFTGAMSDLRRSAQVDANRELNDPNTVVDSGGVVFQDNRAESRSGSSDADPESDTPSYEEIELSLLASDDYQLGEVYSKLRRLDAYRPILHVAWTQPALDKEVTGPIELQRLGKPPAHLSGSVRLYLSRFLHLVIDLDIEAKAPKPNSVLGQPTQRFGNARSSSGMDVERRMATMFYRIEEDRIVRNGEIRYYDHPRFGVVAKVWRVEPEMPDP